MGEGGENSKVGEGLEDDEDSKMGEVGRIARWVKVDRTTRILRVGEGGEDSKVDEGLADDEDSKMG